MPSNTIGQIKRTFILYLVSSLVAVLTISSCFKCAMATDEPKAGKTIGIDLGTTYSCVLVLSKMKK